MAWVSEDLSVGNEAKYYHRSSKNAAHWREDYYNRDTVLLRFIRPYYDMLRTNVHALNRTDNFLKFVEDIIRFNPEVLADYFQYHLDCCVSLTAIELLDDTINFLETGQRNVPLSTYVNVLSAGADDYKVTPAEQAECGRLADKVKLRMKSLRKLQSKEDILAYINMWCQHPGGFKDMVTTLYILESSKRL